MNLLTKFVFDYYCGFFLCGLSLLILDWEFDLIEICEDVIFGDYKGMIANRGRS
jgi:hypothetical protein